MSRQLRNTKLPLINWKWSLLCIVIKNTLIQKHYTYHHIIIIVTHSSDSLKWLHITLTKKYLTLFLYKESLVHEQHIIKKIYALTLLLYRLYSVWTKTLMQKNNFPLFLYCDILVSKQLINTDKPPILSLYLNNIFTQ